MSAAAGNQLMTPYKRFRILIQRLFQDTTKWRGVVLVAQLVSQRS